MSLVDEALSTGIYVPRRRGLLERAMQDQTRILDVVETEEKDVDRQLPQLEPMSEYATEPEKFMVDKLGIPQRTLRWSMNPGYDSHQWDGTPDPLLALVRGLAEWHDVCVEAGTGTQKSYTAAAAILWFLASFFEARVFTFAPKEEQLRSFIWMEINKLWPRFIVLFPTAVITDLRIRMRGERDSAWGAQGYSVAQKAGEDSSTKAQGMHAPHMLLVYEETPGIPVPVIEAGENTCTAPHNLRLALGNPDHQLDGLHLFGHDEYGLVRPRMRAIRISALDHPNVVAKDDSIVPGAASSLSIERRRLRYGTEHRMFRSRVRGISPAESAEALIKLEWVQRAQKRFEDAETRKILEAVGKGARSLGVDVANSEDGDQAAISRWKGAVCREVPAFPCPNSNNLGYQVYLEMGELDDERRAIDPQNVGVDGVGVGAGTVNELRNREKYIRSLVGGAEGVIEEEQWNNLRSQMWWTLAEDLRLDRIALPPDVDLARELITPTWKAMNGKIVVESKEELKKRLPGGKSPNKGDAVVYGNFVRPRDPVVVEIKRKGAKTLKERIWEEMQKMDEPTIKRNFGTVLRQ